MIFGLIWFGFEYSLQEGALVPKALLCVLFLSNLVIAYCLAGYLHCFEVF